MDGRDNHSLSCFIQYITSLDLLSRKWNELTMSMTFRKMNNYFGSFSWHIPNIEEEWIFYQQKKKQQATKQKSQTLPTPKPNKKTPAVILPFFSKFYLAFESFGTHLPTHSPDFLFQFCHSYLWDNWWNYRFYWTEIKIGVSSSWTKWNIVYTVHCCTTNMPYSMIYRKICFLKIRMFYHR